LEDTQLEALKLFLISGIIGATCYNKFKGTKLPDWLSFFSGKRCVAIVAGVVSIIVSAILLFIWPLLFGALVAIGESIVGLGPVGAGIYAFLNRLLIPTFEFVVACCTDNTCKDTDKWVCNFTKCKRFCCIVSDCSWQFFLLSVSVSEWQTTMMVQQVLQH